MGTSGRTVLVSNECYPTKRGIRRGQMRGSLHSRCEAFSSMATVIGGGEQMASGAEVRSNDSVNLEESLGVLAGLEPAHSLLALTGGLMRVLCAVVQVAVLSMSN